MNKKESLTIVKKINKITLITLVGFSCFTGCSLPFEPELSTIEFELDARMEVDLNGYYHLTLDTTKWQTTHRISGHVFSVQKSYISSQVSFFN